MRPMSSLIPRLTAAAGAVVVAAVLPVAAAYWPAPDVLRAPESQTNSARPTVSPLPSSLVAPAVLQTLDAQTRTGAALQATDPYCDTPDAVAANLVDSYGEEMERRQTLSGGRTLELWYSAEMGTWTAVYIRADAVACVAGYGGGDLPYAEDAEMTEAFDS